MSLFTSVDPKEVPVLLLVGLREVIRVEDLAEHGGLGLLLDLVAWFSLVCTVEPVRRLRLILVLIHEQLDFIDWIQMHNFII